MESKRIRGEKGEAGAHPEHVICNPTLFRSVPISVAEEAGVPQLHQRQADPHDWFSRLLPIIQDVHYWTLMLDDMSGGVAS